MVENSDVNGGCCQNEANIQDWSNILIEYIKDAPAFGKVSWGMFWATVPGVVADTNDTQVHEKRQRPGQYNYYSRSSPGHETMIFDIEDNEEQSV